MTYPLIGNYGTTAEDQESHGVQVAGFIVRELTPRAQQLPQPPRPRHVPQGQQRHRHRGHRHAGAGAPAARPRVHERRALHAPISTTPRWSRRPARSPAWRAAISCSEVVPDEGVRVEARASARSRSTSCRARRPTQHVVAIDYGMKWNILRCLTQVGLQGDGRARHRDGRRGARAQARTASSSRTAPATRPPSATPSTP